MSNSNGTSYTARSMNGIITIDDGAGTVIEDGIITTNELDVTKLVVTELSTNTIKAQDPTGTCNIWQTNSGVCNYSKDATANVNFASGASANVVIGPAGATVNVSNMSIGVSSNFTGEIRLGNSTGSSKIRLNSANAECQATPTTLLGIVNKTYADGLITALKLATNIWTGLSNTFNNVVYCSLIQPLTLTGTLAIATVATNILSLGNGTGVCTMNGSNTTVKANSTLLLESISGNASLIASGVNVLVQSALGTATIDAPNGNIILSTNTGFISMVSRDSYVNIEGINIIGKALQANAVASTVDFFNNGNTATLNIGNSATAVNIGGTKTNTAVNGNYSVEMNAGSNSCWVDFHSYATAVNDYDARIYCNGASAGTATGLLQIISANTRFTGGISFSKGNLSAGQNIQTGSSSGYPQVAANSAGGSAITITFTTAFTSNPVVTVCTNSSSGINAAGLIVSVTAVSTSNFSFYVYNARSVNSGLWGVKWIAIGGY